MFKNFEIFDLLGLSGLQMANLRSQEFLHLLQLNNEAILYVQTKHML